MEVPERFTAREQVMLRPKDAKIIRSAADDCGMSISAVIREAVNSYLPQLQEARNGHTTKQVS